MKLLVSKFLYPDYTNLKEVLFPFRDLNIQLAFFKKKDFFKFDHKNIIDICNSLNIKIPIIHAPCIDIFDEEFLKILEFIKDIYKIKLITIHPQEGDAKSALKKLEELGPTIKRLDLILAYENFPKTTQKRKWVNLPKDMYEKFNLPFLKITFDTAHLDEPANCLNELGQIFDKVEVIHLSDKNSKFHHLPLGEGILPYKKLLDYLKEKNYNGFLVLEYLDEFQDKLIRDFKEISKIFLK